MYVFIFPLFTKEITIFELVEAYDKKNGFSHSGCVIISGFNSIDEAILYCKEFDYTIVN